MPSSFDLTDDREEEVSSGSERAAVFGPFSSALPARRWAMECNTFGVDVVGLRNAVTDITARVVTAGIS